MKKFAALLLVIVLSLSAAACRKQDIPLIVSGISFTADISYYNEKYIGLCDIDDNGDTQLSLTFPEDLKGLRFRFCGQELTAEYMGLTYTPKSDGLPVSSAAGCLYGILRKIAEDTETAAYSGGKENCSVDITYNSKKYSFEFSPSGLPLSITGPDGSLKIIFSDITQKS